MAHPASIRKIAKSFQLLLQERTILATVQGDTGTGSGQEAKRKQIELQVSSLFSSLAVSLQCCHVAKGASWHSRNVVFRVLAWVPQQGTKGWVCSYGTILDLCLTPQFSYYFEFMRKQDNERIKETFIYEPLEIIITLEKQK